MEGPRINELPDDLLLKILSSLPISKHTIATNFISKRWRGLSKLVSDLTIDDGSYPCFVYTFLLLNNAQLLQRLHLKFSRYYNPALDINAWVQAAVDRSVRVVRIDLFGKTLELPSCLSTCTTLKTLILHELRIEVVPPWFRLPSLKTLHLLSVKFSGDESVASLVRICPVLEALVVDQTKYDNVMMFNVNVPIFRSLYIDNSKEKQTMEEPSINKLPDKLLSKILSSLSIKQSVETNLLSKRWRGLSRLVSHLKFDDKSFRCFVAFRRFVYRSLLFNNAQVLERLDLKLRLHSWVTTSDINAWVQTAVKRSLRELSIDLFGKSKTLKLPSCLSTCRTLKTLILSELSIEVIPQWFSLPSLKSLHLLSVKFSGNESVASLLGNCPELEYLVVNQTKDDNVMIFSINVPTLKSLIIDNSKGKRAHVEEIHGFVIKAPALRNLNFKDTFSNFVMFEYMPEMIKANIEVICDQSEKFIGSLTSIQHLSLCSLTSKTPYPRGTFFFFLEHLELCTCSAGWWNLLTCILNDAPRLRSLKLKSKHSAHYNDRANRFNEPTSVPECLSKHLEILEWRQYKGIEQERNVAAYILANATCLKKATFSTRCRNKYHGMLKKLKKMQRVSENCKLVFE